MTSPLKRIAVALAAVSLLALVGASAASAEATKTAKGNVFFHNDLMSVGLSCNAHFGTHSTFGGSSGYYPYLHDSGCDELAPVGYPTFMGGSGSTAALTNGTEYLGFVAVADPTKPGSWDDTVGDFFTPGTPYEGLILQANGQTAHNDNSHEDISGDWSSVSSGDTSFTWNSDADWQGLSVKQVSRILPNSTLLDSTVTLTNNTSSDVTDVYYGRSVDPDNCAKHSGSYSTTNVIVSQVGVDGGAKSMVEGSADCDGHTETIGLVSRDPGTWACNHCWGIDPKSFITGGDPQQAAGESLTADSGIALAIPANPDKGNTLAPGESVTLHFTYFLNAADADKAGLPTDVITVVPPTGAGTPGGTPTGSIKALVNGTPGHSYEISSTDTFATFKTVAAGSTISVKATTPGYKKGKVGTTTVYVRDTADPDHKVVAVALPWDFSPPWIVWGSVRTVFGPDNKTVLKGRWDVNVSARDTAAPGDTRGLWAELSYAKWKPSDKTALPTALVADKVIKADGFNHRVWGPTRPRWVRVSDSWGNKSAWHGLGNMPTYPNTKR